MRPFTEEDLADVLALLVADEEEIWGRPSRIGPADLRQWLSQTDLAQDSWLHEDAEGIAAVGWLDLHGDVASAIGVVHPRAKGRGLGGLLLERSEARGRERGAERMHQFALGRDARAAELLAGRGYVQARRFYEMAIELDDAPPEPSLPVGLSLETLREEDVRAFHDALDEAFRDHWEHHSQPFEEWWERHRRNPDHDPTLWFLVRDGDEVAAAVRNEPNRNGGGYVGAIGVRRQWRGRGCAKALLLHTFGEFRSRGVTRVTLGVDAESPTGATHLYERVGMHVEEEHAVWEKSLG